MLIFAWLITVMKKQEQFRQVIHLYFVETDEHYYFGSLSALYEHYNHIQLGVALQTLYNQWKTNVYSNEKVVIRKGKLISKKNEIKK